MIRKGPGFAAQCPEHRPALEPEDVFRVAPSAALQDGPTLATEDVGRNFVESVYLVDLFNFSKAR